jgi:hypothetical protein
MRNKVLAPLVVVLGLFVLYGGFTTLNSDNVTCGGKTMRNGQTCREVHRRSGHTTRRSFIEQRDDNQSTGYVLLGIGSVLVIGGVVWTFVTYRRRPAAPQNYLPPGAPPFHPPQGGPPQYPPPGGQPHYPPPAPPPPR